MRKFIVFLDSVKDYGADPRWHRFGFPLVYNEFNLVEGGSDLETLRDFTKVSSDFYPDLECHYSHVIDEWHDVVREQVKKDEQQ